MKDGCCADKNGDGRMDCCEDMAKAGRKSCCEKSEAQASGEAHANH